MGFAGLGLDRADQSTMMWVSKRGRPFVLRLLQFALGFVLDPRRWKHDRPMSRAAFEARFPDDFSGLLSEYQFVLE